MSKIFDLLIIGGGVNGCGIARDAAGRGLSVCLCEQNDLASATSSASTKLFHGGLRYLEYYKFRLVRESLIEREILLRAMPHISWPLRFVLPYTKGLRPAWMLRLGLFIYDHLGGRKILPGTRTLNLRQHEAGQVLKPHLRKGFEYSDCWVEDARLVMLNAKDAQNKSAQIYTHTHCCSAKRHKGLWQVEVKNTQTGALQTLHTRILINAAGPWVEQVLRKQLAQDPDIGVRLVRGSHIIVKKLFDHDMAYIFQQPDGRIIFALPFEQDFTLIGTTDNDHEGPPENAVCKKTEVEYLCRAASQYFIHPIVPNDVVWTYSGVRPLYDDGVSSASAATRDYVLKLDAPDGEAPLLSVFGGKITTYRRLAETALGKLHRYFPQMAAPWTAKAALPGGDFQVHELSALQARLARDFSFLDKPTTDRYIRQFGTQAWAVLADTNSQEQLGRNFGGGIWQIEVEWMIDHEFATTAEDIVWRRTRQGLRMNDQEIKTLDAWMTNARNVNSSISQKHE